MGRQLSFTFGDAFNTRGRSAKVANVRMMSPTRNRPNMSTGCFFWFFLTSAKPIPIIIHLLSPGDMRRKPSAKVNFLNPFPIWMEGRTPPPPSTTKRGAVSYLNVSPLISLQRLWSPFNRLGLMTHKNNIVFLTFQ